MTGWNGKGLSLPEFMDRYGTEEQCEQALVAATRWFLAMRLLARAKNNGSALELTRQLGVSYRTADSVGAH